VDISQNNISNHIFISILIEGIGTIEIDVGLISSVGIDQIEMIIQEVMQSLEEEISYKPIVIRYSANGMGIYCSNTNGYIYRNTIHDNVYGMHISNSNITVTGNTFGDHIVWIYDRILTGYGIYVDNSVISITENYMRAYYDNDILRTAYMYLNIYLYNSTGIIKNNTLGYGPYLAIEYYYEGIYGSIWCLDSSLIIIDNNFYPHLALSNNRYSIEVLINGGNYTIIKNNLFNVYNRAIEILNTTTEIL